jgi:plastocyanin
MARRGSSHGRLRLLACAVGSAASVLTLGAATQAPAEEGDATRIAPAASAAPAPAPPAAMPAPTTVTVSRASASASRSVSIVDFAYDPASLSVKAGDTVTWTNQGTAEEGHNVIGGELESPTLHTGESYSHTFSRPGTFSYVCTIHPEMEGNVEVLDRSSGGSGKEKNDKKGSGEAGGSSGGGSSGGSAGGNSESAATSSPDPSGSSGSLPSTGGDLLPLTDFGLVLLAAGLALRLLGGLRQR